MNLYVGKKLRDWELILVANMEKNELSHLSTDDLAWLTHECEHHNDDVAMGLLSEIVENRPAFGETYRAIWKQHAQVRGYDFQPTREPLT